MGKFLDALKNLGNKLNGTTPSSTTTVAVINEIADDFANGTTATKEYVNSLMSGALKRAIVAELPTEDIDTNTIYMVLDATAAQGNVYNEYLYINNAWELIGTTAVSGGGDLGHTLTVQFSTVYDRGSDIPPAQYQVFQVALLKYLNGNVVISNETINDNNEHTFENVIAYAYTYAGDTDLGSTTEEVISETGITSELNSVYDADNYYAFEFMTQLFTNSNKVVKYVVALPA